MSGFSERVDRSTFAELQRRWLDLVSDQRQFEEALVLTWSDRFARMRSMQADLQASGLWTRGPADFMAVLQIARDEVRNCRVLRWLLDPLAPHGMGSTFLRRVLARVAASADVELDFTGTDQANVIVEESRRIPGWSATTRADVVVYGPGYPTTPAWTVLLEAKVDAPEGDRQGDGLAAAWQAEEPLKVFLTPDGRRMHTGDHTWIPLRWSDLAAELRAALATGSTVAEGRPTAIEYLRSMEAHLT